MTERKKIIVVGANGNVARQIIPLLIKNYEVYCLTRSPPSFAINSIFLRFIEGDALSSQVWDECLQGKDAVISCFGTRQGEPEENHLQFLKLVTQKMAEKGVKRFIGFFSHGALKNNDGHHVYQSQGFHNKQKGQMHSQCIETLKNSELDYTAICLWKFQIGAGELQAIENNWSQTSVKSQGVVQFLKNQLQSPHFLRKVVFLRNKQ